MADRERAKAQRAVARSVEKGTRRSLEPFPCDAERPEGQTPASAGGCADAATADAYQCADDSSRQGVGLGPWGAVLFASEPAAALEVPPGAEPAGYAKVIVDYGLTVTPPHRLTFIGSRGGKTITERNGRTIVVLPPGYRPSPALTSQLAFALKYDGVNLEVLAALFRRVDSEAFERELAGFLAAHPTSQYSRRIWFLYEFLTDRRLPIDDIQAALRYVPLLDEREYFTAPRAPSRRHRVIDNLLGTRAFCPMVRRTERLRDFEARSLGEEARRIVAEFDEDAIRRAVSYLYSKETRSSFGIEGERLSTSRTERFVDLLRTVPELTSLTREHLVRLQAATVDPRFAEDGYRNDQVYVAEPMDLVRQRIHFIAPRPEDVPSMMEGLLACQRRLEGSQVDPVVHAAVVAFGFLFVHPFEDGNGRIHRLLIHYVLSRRGFTPKGIIFPVSAVMLQRRREYDEALEAFSVPLMRLIDYDESEDGVVSVRNETAHLYRYFDATPMAEALYRWVEQTVRKDFRCELEFVVGFRETRRAIDSVVDMPDRHANLFIKLCLQNNGRLSPAKRARHFAFLRDEEVAALEQAVQANLFRFPRAQGGDLDVK